MFVCRLIYIHQIFQSNETWRYILRLVFMHHLKVPNYHMTGITIAFTSECVLCVSCIVSMSECKTNAVTQDITQEVAEIEVTQVKVKVLLCLIN